ncbi:uncharacterized protein PG986_014764 [Apiospora aurea]|uniref:Transmembrane protein n=1 Tax=Apiospora aurea TaxID=335848 RepID=A0ABR1PTX5_9PEZI
MQRGRPTRTPSLTSSLADSRSPSPYARSRSHSRPPPYPTSTHHNNVRWSSSVSPDAPLRNRSSYAPPPQQQHSSSSRRRDSFATNRPPTPPQQQKRKPSVSFLKDQIKEKIKDEKPTAKDVKHKVKGSSTLKTSLMFLGSVAAATYVANRFWPRGITYGDKEAWEEDRRRGRRRRSASRRREGGRRGSFDDEEENPRLYRRGRGVERVVYGEEPIRRAPSRGGRSDHTAAASGYTVVRTAASRPVSVARQERYRDDSRDGGRRASSSSYYYYDGGDHCYYSTRRRDDDADEFDDGRRSAVYREPRYVEHQVTTLRRSSSDDPYTTTERVVRRQYHLDDR